MTPHAPRAAATAGLAGLSTVACSDVLPSALALAIGALLSLQSVHRVVPARPSLPGSQPPF